MEGDRREAVVEDSSIAQAIYISAEGTRILNGSMLILTLLIWSHLGCENAFGVQELSTVRLVERSPSLRREVQPTAEFRRFCLLK